MTEVCKKKTCTVMRRGVVLMVVLVVLVVLSVLAYALGEKVMARRHRDSYLVDYQAARYACDSAVKYALTTLADMNDPNLIIRNGMPDFSDTFLYDEQQYREVLAEWAERMSDEELARRTSKRNRILGSEGRADGNDINDVNEILDFNEFDLEPNQPGNVNDVNLLVIPGPYGPPWPLIKERTRFMIGTATVTIEMHDENAKYPIGWTMLKDPKLQRETDAAFDTFCEWMDVNKPDASELNEQLDELNEIKEYKLEFKTIEKVKTKRVKVAARKTRRGRRSRSRPRYKTKKEVTKIPGTVHLTDFARMFHGSLVDTEFLTRPTVVTEDRAESPAKYMGLWGSSRVNINSAPRQVLEAAFVFGGDADQIAQAVIEARQRKPFTDPNEMRRQLYSYSGNIDKCKPFIVTASDYFTIRITANSGVARASAVIAVKRVGNEFRKIAVLSG